MRARISWPRCGSSPHTRGTPCLIKLQWGNNRFIPAYAGNAKRGQSTPVNKSVHPRIRGERGETTPDLFYSSGSSPHTRGTHYARAARMGLQRFIPAYAGNAAGLLALRRRLPVHPRIRGERRFIVQRVIFQSGSSPHTRGTHIVNIENDGKRRFIPAYAGNAPPIAKRSRSGSVHPRIRGERHTASDGLKTRTGSSPHTRGTLRQAVDSPRGRRFIPAYAGNAVSERGMIETKTGSSPHTRGTLAGAIAEGGHGRFIPAYAGNARRPLPHWKRTSVHPRIRGERVSCSCTSSRWPGSSPHTRGTHPVLFHDCQQVRFIPAYAGNAVQQLAGRHVPAVHPRIRGERPGDQIVEASTFGSSPHTRGTQERQAPEGHSWRFIPAYAGNARRPLPHWKRTSVHPRIRGERVSCSCTSSRWPGSSPHTRGTLRRRSLAGKGARFIPAYAGNAEIDRIFWQGDAVHPRIRGERGAFLSVVIRGPGSSPHTRGTPAVPASGGNEHRFIPAYAGNARPLPCSHSQLPVHPRIRGERCGS